MGMHLFGHAADDDGGGDFVDRGGVYLERFWINSIMENEVWL